MPILAPVDKPELNFDTEFEIPDEDAVTAEFEFCVEEGAVVIVFEVEVERLSAETLLVVLTVVEAVIRSVACQLIWNIGAKRL